MSTSTLEAGASGVVEIAPLGDPQWALDERGWCAAAELHEHQPLLSAAPALRDAVLNMLGVFDNAVARRVINGALTKEAIQSAKDALEAAGVEQGSLPGQWASPAPAAVRKESQATRAIAIADQCMFELLLAECLHDSDDGLVLALTDDGCQRVATLAQASDAVQEAVEWLSERCYVEIAKDGAGERVRILNRPGDDN